MVNKYYQKNKEKLQKQECDIKIFLKKKKRQKRGLRQIQKSFSRRKRKAASIYHHEIRIFLQKKVKVEYMRNYYLAPKNIFWVDLQIFLILRQKQKYIEFPCQVFQKLFSCYTFKKLNFLFYNLFLEIWKNSKMLEIFMKIKKFLL